MPTLPTTATAVYPLVVGRVSIKLQGTNAVRLDAVLELWEQLFVVSSGQATGEGVTVRLRDAHLLASGEEVYAAEALQVLKTASGFFLRCGASAFAVAGLGNSAVPG